MTDFLDPISLITSGAIVVFLTQQAKRWIPSDFLPLVALVFGVVIQLVNDLALAVDPPSYASVWTSIVVGAGVGMAAAGTYDLVGRAAAEVPPAQIFVDETYVPSDEGLLPADLPEVLHQPDAADPRRAAEGDVL